jgi:hypothetical protein
MMRQLHERFLAGCGVFGRWGISVSQPGAVVEENAFSQAFAIVGNGKGTNLHLPGSEMGRKHAYLQVLKGGLFCVDLSPRRGVRWGDQCQPYGWVRPGESIGVGPYTLDLCAIDQDSWLARSAMPQPDPLDHATNEKFRVRPIVVEISNAGKVLAMEHMSQVMALVGRSPMCLFRLNHPSVSEFHCSLVRSPPGLWIVDLLSRPGTFVGDKRISFGQMKEGQSIQIGDYSLRFRYLRRPGTPNGEVVGKVEDRGREPARSFVNHEGAQEAKEPQDHATNDKNTILASSGSYPVAPRGSVTMVAALDEPSRPPWSAVAAMMQQFNRMQQDMFDQFQEQMLGTMQMFSSLQQDQISVLGKELEQLRAISSELRSLQEQLKVPTSQPGPTLTGVPAADNVKAVKEQAVNPVGSNGVASAPAGNHFPGPGSATADAVVSEEGKAAPARAASPPTPEIHSWLSQRISALQEERQTRWHKLLDMILGS